MVWKKSNLDCARLSIKSFLYLLIPNNLCHKLNIGNANFVKKVFVGFQLFINNINFVSLHQG